METKRLTLAPKTKSDALAMIDAMSPADRVHVSADWLARLQASAERDPWVHGFTIVERETGARIGDCGFKKPPSTDGTVEIAYAVDPDYQGQGFATEAAQALVAFAFADERVSMVRAHTLVEVNASARVLTKVGFRHVGEVVEPDDGLVSRWERNRGDVRDSGS